MRDVASDGFCIVEAVLDKHEVQRLIELVECQVTVGAGRGGVGICWMLPCCGIWQTVSR